MASSLSAVVLMMALTVVVVVIGDSQTFKNPYHPAPQPYYRKVTTTTHKKIEQPKKPAQQKCSVEDVVLRAEICTPGLLCPK